MQTFDVAVLGGGPAGASTAIALLQKGYSVLLIEKSQFDGIRYGETLVPKVRESLVKLGVWEQFLAGNHLKSSGVQSAWGMEELYENNFLFNPYGNGWNLDRRKFDSMLLHASEKAGAKVMQGASVITSSDSPESGWTFSIHSQDCTQEYCARFMVDATGRSAVVAKLKGAKRLLSDRLMGVAAYFQTPKDPFGWNGCTLIESEENGWWYSAALPDDKTVAVFMTDADIYARCKKASTDFWQNRLEASTYTKERIRFSNVLSRLQPIAAHSAVTSPAAGSNWLAVGDAAMSFDPLSSQGIYKGLNSGIQAAKSIDEVFSGNREVLSSYSKSIESAFAHYLQIRKTYYLKNQRWPGSAFWKRRHLDG